jgi:4-hydroxythreonine-4-phosphate dehydrogenase
MSEAFITIAVTQGDPSGIGPEVVARALAAWRRPEDCRVVVLGYPRHFVFDSPKTPIPPAPEAFDSFEAFRSRKEWSGVEWVSPGPEELNARVDRASTSAGASRSDLAARAAFQCIQSAIELANARAVDAICTAPIDKESLARAGLARTGHTEILAAGAGVDRVAMMLCAAGLRVVLATIHEPLARAPSLITREKLSATFELALEAMADFNVDAPRIAVAGLNPHAGEGGLLGLEEEEVIRPAIEAFRPRGVLFGPFSADTIFHRARRGEFDAVIAMYHDQGSIPIKTLDFHGGVNVTLGLPFARTSPDHGTAPDIAGLGVARPDSMLAALQTAYDLARIRRARRRAPAR